jgi:hypothetical protein
MNTRYVLTTRRIALYRGDFHCLHCRRLISDDPRRSRVQNRNHCPCCLWSRHVDLTQAGDRLSACKAQMEPVGLALKQSVRRYGPPNGGELMLIHRCIECGKLSINRLAADDFGETLLEIFERSRKMAPFIRRQLADGGILALRAADLAIVEVRLFGKN